MFDQETFKIMACVYFFFFFSYQVDITETECLSDRSKV